MGTARKNHSRLALLLLPLLAACGQISPLGSQTPRVTDVSMLQAIYSPQSDTSTSCRYKESIVPEHDQWLDGTGYYSVCPSSENADSVTVFGTAPDGAKQYCFFPVLVTDSGSIYPRIDVQGVPIVTCSNKTLGAQVFTFDHTNYNAAFVVPYQDRNAMQVCLGSGDYFSCPRSFSYGQFRD